MKKLPEWLQLDFERPRSNAVYTQAWLICDAAGRLDQGFYENWMESGSHTYEHVTEALEILQQEAIRRAYAGSP